MGRGDTGSRQWRTPIGENGNQPISLINLIILYSSDFFTFYKVGEIPLGSVTG